MSSSSTWSDKLKLFLHDPIDKCFDIPTHIKRAAEYGQKIGISDVLIPKRGPDQIASCMERSILPDNITQNFDEIRHPFAESHLSVPNFNKKEIFNAINKAFDHISIELPNVDEKTKFFYLWRNLQSIIFQQNINVPWAKYLPLLPADTRIPDHSIWEHLKIATAISASSEEIDGNDLLIQNNTMLLFSIGPVQSYISQARKTQDFYLGSFILSYLTFKAKEIIINKYGPTNIIYPDLYSQPLVDNFIAKIFQNNNIKIYDYYEPLIQLPTIPNRFVALIPISEKEQIIEIINLMKNNILKALDDATECIIKKFVDFEISPKTWDKISLQLANFPEIYWVAIPWRVKGRDNYRDISFEDLKDYFDQNILKTFTDLWDFASKCSKNGKHKPNIGLLYELLYSALEKSIGARKNLKEFNQPTIEECGRKCSICGERDVIFFHETNNKTKFTKYSSSIIDITEKIKKDRLLKYLSDGEGLCAVCFVKRAFIIYLEQKVSKIFANLTFPSTAEIACSDYKEKIIIHSKKLYSDYCVKFQKLIDDSIPETNLVPKLIPLFARENKLEGSFFYKESLTKEYIQENLGIEINSQNIADLLNALNKIYSEVGAPNPYYAIIHLDGDNMGKWLSGDLLPSIQSAYNSSVWQKLEKILIDYDENKQSQKVAFTSKLQEILPKINNNIPRKLLTPAIHASISAALRNYTFEFVKKIVEEEHLGKLVYAGGDDVLAFVNLKDLLGVMHKLRWSFSGHIKIQNNSITVDLQNSTGFVEKDGKYILTMGPNATASMGVVIAHYKTPLQLVINKVKKMEEEAKRNGKDGFTICLLKHSGAEIVASAKWCYTSSNTEPFDTIQKLLDLINAFNTENKFGFIAKGFVQKVSQNFSHLKNNNGEFVLSSSIFEKEIYRLLNNSYNPPSIGKISKQDKQNFINSISNLINQLFSHLDFNLDYFLNFCKIALFINNIMED